MKTRYGTCCNKRRYATCEAAEADLARIRAYSDAPYLPERVYVCHLGWHHLTSNSEDEHRDRVMERAEAPLEQAARENA